MANILLDILDKELERRNHKFARYADDVIILCKSLRSAQRTFVNIKRFIEEELLLKINIEKSKVQKISPKIKFLGFGFYKLKCKGKKSGRYRPIVHAKSKARLKNTIKYDHLRRHAKVSVKALIHKLTAYLMGWTHYFALGISETNMNDVEGWIRHRIRAMYLTMWKKNTTKEENFIMLKTSSRERCHIIAHSSLGIWAKARYANYIITNKVIRKLWGWPSILDIVKAKSWAVLGY